MEIYGLINWYKPFQLDANAYNNGCGRYRLDSCKTDSLIHIRDALLTRIKEQEMNRINGAIKTLTENRRKTKVDMDEDKEVVRCMTYEMQKKSGMLPVPDIDVDVIRVHREG